MALRHLQGMLLCHWQGTSDSCSIHCLLWKSYVTVITAIQLLISAALKLDTVKSVFQLVLPLSTPVPPRPSPTPSPLWYFVALGEVHFSKICFLK